MTAPGSLTIDLSPEAAQLVQRAVQAGEFPDVQTAVETAVRAMSAQRDDVLGYSMDELRQLGDEGEASGPGQEPDFEGIKREAFRRAGVPAARA